MPFQQYLSQCTYQCFPGALLTNTKHNIFSKPLAAFASNHCGSSGHRLERGTNPVAMTKINPQKEYRLSQGSNQIPPVLKSCRCQTEIHVVVKVISMAVKMEHNLNDNI